MHRHRQCQYLSLYFSRSDISIRRELALSGPNEDPVVVNDRFWMCMWLKRQKDWVGGQFTQLFVINDSNTMAENTVCVYERAQPDQSGCFSFHLPPSLSVSSNQIINWFTLLNLLETLRQRLNFLFDCVRGSWELILQVKAKKSLACMMGKWWSYDVHLSRRDKCLEGVGTSHTHENVLKWGQMFNVFHTKQDNHVGGGIML